mgnify:FL=1
MRVFIHPKENYFLFTNLKVMYGTLSRQKGLISISNKVLPIFLLRDKLFFKKRKKYLIVRNPYEKIVSFYTHKFVFNKLYTSENNLKNIKVQNCQRIFFPLLGLSGKEEKKIIGKRLTELSFEDFIKLLPQVYDKDDHLWPQFWAFHIRYKGFPIMPLSYNKVYLIEKNMNDIREKLKIDIGIRANKTYHDSYEKYFSSISYAIVNEIYNKDFLFFGYGFNM